MRFNLLVGVVWRFITFVLAATTSLLALGLCNEFLPGSWAPLGLSLGYSVLFESQAWLKKRGLARRTSWTMTSAICAGWLISSGLTGHYFDFEYLPAIFFEFLFVLMFLGTIAKTFSLPKKDRAIGGWLCGMIVCAAFVSVGSSSAGGAEVMVDFCRRLGMSAHDAEILVIILRKAIHFSFYGVFGLIARNAAMAAKEKPDFVWRFSLLAVFALATFDESRQIMVPGRGASAFDVMLDLTGALCFGLLAATRASRRKAKP